MSPLGPLRSVSHGTSRADGGCVTAPQAEMPLPHPHPVTAKRSRVWGPSSAPAHPSPGGLHSRGAGATSNCELVVSEPVSKLSRF